MSDNEQWVRADLGLKAATEAYLGCFPPQWKERVTCAACEGQGRGYRNEAGEFASEPLPRVANTPGIIDKEALKAAGFEWWFCAACHAYGYHEHPAVPTHTPAGATILAGFL